MIITEEEYRQYDQDENGVIKVTSMVLREIGIRKAIIHKITPSDFEAFGSCYFLLFTKHLNVFNQQYPECMDLLDKCWQYFFKSITFAFDMEQ